MRCGDLLRNRLWWLALDLWLAGVLFLLVLLTVGLGHDFATLGALVIHARTRDLVEAKLGHIDVFLADRALFSGCWCLTLRLIAMFDHFVVGAVLLMSIRALLSG